MAEHPDVPLEPFSPERNASCPLSCKSLGSKRKQVGADDIDHIVKLHGAFEEGDRVRILDTDDFGYTTVTVNRPLRDEAGNINLDKKGTPEPDPKLVSLFGRAPTGDRFVRRHAA